MPEENDSEIEIYCKEKNIPIKEDWWEQQAKTQRMLSPNRYHLIKIKPTNMKASINFTVLLLISTLFLNGCAVLVLDRYEFNSTPIDFSKFKEQGVFVTTGDMSQKYQSVSILVVECYHGFIPKADYNKNLEGKLGNKNDIDDIYAKAPKMTSDDVKDFTFKACTLDDLFAEIISQAQSKGANGIIQLDIRNTTRTGVSGISQRGIQIVGLAIKIEE